MKILVLNGSPKEKSDTFRLTDAFLQGMNQSGEHEVHIVHVREKQIALVPGNAFNKAGEGYIRIACTLPEEKLVSAAREIVEFADRE